MYINQKMIVLVASFLGCLFLCGVFAVIGSVSPKTPTPTARDLTLTPAFLPTVTPGRVATNDAGLPKSLLCKSSHSSEFVNKTYTGFCLVNPLFSKDRVLLEESARETCEGVTVTVLCSLWIWDDSQYVPEKPGEQTDEQIDELVARLDVGPFRNTDCFSYYENGELSYISDGC